LAQICENEHLAAVFGERFEAEGSEIYLRPADAYVEPGRETTFAIRPRRATASSGWLRTEVLA
jgi:hypothetical protein